MFDTNSMNKEPITLTITLIKSGGLTSLIGPNTPT